MGFMWAFFGFLLGLSSGESSGRKKCQKKLGEFAELRGLRIVDRDGNEVPASELVAALK
jgi:hypothetical protein